MTSTYHRSMAQLAFLAPDIQSTILEGRQPAGLTLESLLKTIDFIVLDRRATSGLRRFDERIYSGEALSDHCAIAAQLATR